MSDLGWPLRRAERLFGDRPAFGALTYREVAARVGPLDLEPGARVVVVPREPVTADALLEHCRAAIAGFKVPREVELRDEPLPKSGPGNVLKMRLREPFWAGRERRVN